MISENVTNVLAKETFDAFAELLHAVDIFLVKGPIGIFSWSEGSDALVHLIVPGNIGDQVFDVRESFDRLNGNLFSGSKAVHARFAHKRRSAVYFGRARA